MVAVFGVGLWTIITFGSLLLSAPEDLAGEWNLHDPHAEPEDPPAKKLAVDQSGKFFRLQLNGTVLDMRLIEELHYDHRSDLRTRVRLTGTGSEAIFDGVRRGNEFELTMTGLASGVWRAERTSRPYGPDHTPRQVTTPPPTTLPTTLPTTAPADLHAWF